MTSQLIEVESTEFKFAYYPNRISTEAVFTCIAIGFYDFVEQVAWLAHEDSAEGDDNLNNYIDEVLKESSAENLRIWITGAAYQDDEEENACIDINRTYVTDILKKRFLPEQLHFEWCKKDHYANILIDTRSGEPSITIHPMEGETHDPDITDLI